MLHVGSYIRCDLYWNECVLKSGIRHSEKAHNVLSGFVWAEMELNPPNVDDFKYSFKWIAYQEHEKDPWTL